MQDKIRHLLKGIQDGDHRALARGITIVENQLEGYEELLYGLDHHRGPRVIGVTGPPGAGKSTLVNALLSHWTKAGRKIAVLAVDPSSPFNYGALLGDRIRMSEFYNRPDVFIRSLASRGTLGGLNAKILEITDLVKNAPFDYIFVETVGVGQSEVEIAGLADCTIVTLVPEAGDEVQTWKAGIMEIADIFVVNKSDRDQSETLFRNLKIMVHEKAGAETEVAVVKTVATDGTGIPELAGEIDQFLAAHQGASEKRLHLLTEKSWQLIQSRRMRDIDKKQLLEELKNSVKDQNFNLYGFIRDRY